MTPWVGWRGIPPGAPPSSSGSPHGGPGLQPPQHHHLVPRQRVRLRPGPRRHVSLGQGERSEPPCSTRGGADTPATDIICPMYARTHQDQPSAVPKGRSGKWIGLPGETRPLILCEYAHAMGNSLGAGAHYWQAFRDHPRLQGGFVWDWVGSGGWTKQTDEGRHFWAYGGDFGDAPNDRQFCCNGLLFPDRTPSLPCSRPAGPAAVRADADRAAAADGGDPQRISVPPHGQRSLAVAAV